MDSSASSQLEPVLHDLRDIFSKITDTECSPTIKHRRTVMKYTKIPEDNVISMSNRQKRPWGQPRLRRFISVDNDAVWNNRSLGNSNTASFPMTSSRRKIITIAEENESMFPSARKSLQRYSSNINHRQSNRAVATDVAENVKMNSNTNTSRLSNISLSIKDKCAIAKPSFMKNDVNLTKEPSQRLVKVQNTSVKDTISRYNRAMNKNSRNLSESNKQICSTDLDLTHVHKKPPIGPKVNSFRNTNNKRIRSTHKTKDGVINNSLTIIQVPLEDKYALNIIPRHVATCTDKLNLIDVNINTDPAMGSESKSTETTIEKTESYCKENVCDNTTSMSKTILKNTIAFNKGCITYNKENVSLNTTSSNIENYDSEEYVKNEDLHIEYEDSKSSFDDSNIHLYDLEMKASSFEDLNVPNVKLTKDKSLKESFTKSISLLGKHSLSNLKQSPNLIYNDLEETNPYNKHSSFVIHRATVTYTRKQKFNFQVVGNKENAVSNISSPITPYPVNVVSVLKKEIQQKNNEMSQSVSDVMPKQIYHEVNWNNNNNLGLCKRPIDSSKINMLVKPSDIINNLTSSNKLLSNDFISEQFQKELNFIDSFFDSLQYLENNYLSKSMVSYNVDKDDEEWLTHKDIQNNHSKCRSLMSNIQNNTTADLQTSSSKNLCLLNLLIRDEQRRAKNLLFVLKMREDALTDFTKSQILWLENKKKYDNTDVSALKKKQRGVLLKLQHECGEMQRMRKALLTLSEKRKAALIKTKKSIELKLINSVNVDKILSNNKNKLTKTNRFRAPVKCFELSVSSCDDSAYSLTEHDNLLEAPPSFKNFNNHLNSSEKSIQTGDSILGTLLVDRATDIAAENFVVVEGGYLNILFHNLALPEMFSDGRQYEVNENALRNILNSEKKLTNNGNTIKNDITPYKDAECLSSPSTARSLVEEFNQHYKRLVKEDDMKDFYSSPEQDVKELKINNNTIDNSANELYYTEGSQHFINERENNKEVEIEILQQPTLYSLAYNEDQLENSPEICTFKESYLTEDFVTPDIEVENSAKSEDEASDVSSLCHATDSPPLQLVPSDTSSGDSQTCESVAAMAASVSPSVSEAEELMRQQLAIEKEIKQLEQQQSQLLAVREIPDKPPPPYTPPSKTRKVTSMRKFVADETLAFKVQHHLQGGDNDITSDDNVFNEFIRDFCIEAIEKQSCDQSDLPWEACNVLPKKTNNDQVNLEETTDLLREVLTGVVPHSFVGLSSRRSDHIDDILFNEWRRCEPEWTSLHVNEATVKNQVFESIFQKILTETVDEYKRHVIETIESG